MNLYKVTCVYKGTYTEQHFQVYVIAKDSFTAEILALNWMKERKYKYTNFVSFIELAASEDKHKADGVLIMPNEPCNLT